MEIKYLNAKGMEEIDYDYSNDIILFKIKDRDYDYSIELEDVVLDIDKEGFITGIQVFDASNIFNASKEALTSIKNWEFKIRTEEKIIYIQLNFAIISRNKIIEKC